MNVDDVIREAETTGYCHLGYLGLTAIPKQVFALSNLVRLDIGYNEITEVPKEIGALTKLEELWINDNPIDALPQEIGSCIALRSIYMQRTNITRFPREFASLTALVEVDATGCPLKASHNAILQYHGVLGLRGFMRQKAEKRALKAALHQALKYDVFTEEGAMEGADEKLSLIVKQVCAAFDMTDFRSVIRNAIRLFPAKLVDFRVEHVKHRYESLKKDNTRKQLGADLELKMRAIYYNRIEIPFVEVCLKRILESVTVLEDMAFLIQHATQLFPANPADIDGPSIQAGIVALRLRLAEQRQQALEALRKALRTMYPEADVAEIARIVDEIALKLERTSDVLALAADASEIFPADSSMVRITQVVRAFHAHQKEKGVA